MLSVSLSWSSWVWCNFISQQQQQNKRMSAFSAPFLSFRQSPLHPCFKGRAAVAHTQTHTGDDLLSGKLPLPVIPNPPCTVVKRDQSSRWLLPASLCRCCCCCCFGWRCHRCALEDYFLSLWRSARPCTCLSSLSQALGGDFLPLTFIKAYLLLQLK